MRLSSNPNVAATKAALLCHLPMWSLLEQCLARFLSRPVSALSSMSLVVSKRSSRMGSILSCSSTTPLTTDAHLDTGRTIPPAFLLLQPQERQLKNVDCDGGRTYPGLPCSDILQSSDSRLTTGRVAVAAQEDKLIQSHHLRVPKPLSPFRLARDFRYYGQFLMTLPWKR